MTGAAPGPGFSLGYELQPGDFAELHAASPAEKRERARTIQRLVWYIVFGAALTATTVILSRPSAVGPSGPPGLLYALSGGAWALVLLAARVAWRQRPKPTGLRVWQASPRFHGHYHDTVTVHGVTGAAADGSQLFIPWTAVTTIRETERAFNLLNHHGEALATLPKRGLQSPDLIPALRDFLKCSVGGPRPAATQTDPAGQSNP